jgi:hypothetical protein
MRLHHLLQAAAAVLLTSGLSLAQITSNGTGGGAWNAAATWTGGAVPTSASTVTILGTDSVWTATGDTCSSFTLSAGARLTINTGRMIAPTWTANVTSTVTYNTTTVSSASPYGNLVYNSASNGSPDGNLDVQGNLTILQGTLRGLSATTGSRIHTVAGNVVVGPGGTARISAVNSTSATDAICIWDIAGDVSLTGNQSGNRLILYESAGPHTGSAIFNIDGDLRVGAGSQIQFKSSSNTSANYPPGLIALKGDLEMNGTFSIPSGTGTSSGMLLTLEGSTPQTWSGTGAISISTFSFSVAINNPAGVTLTSPWTFNTNAKVLLSDGTLTTSAANLLTIGAVGQILGSGPSSYVDGPLAMTSAATGPTLLMFPIGKGTEYRPVMLTVTQDAATGTAYTAEVFNSAATTRTLPPTLANASSVRHWTVTKGTGANVTNATIDLTYGTDDNVTNVAATRIAKDDGAGAWLDLGGTEMIPGSISSTANFTSFGDFVLATATSTSAEDVSAVPSTFTVHQNYPNPFNPATTIRYGLPSSADVTVKVYDLLGSLVDVPFSGRQEAGYHTVAFDASRLTSGVYLYQIQAGSEVRMMRMVLAK